MTDTELIIEVAKLDGWLDVEEYTYKYDYAGDSGELKQFQGRNPNDLGTLAPLKPYLTSLDAIIPVIVKMWLDKAPYFLNGLIFRRMLRAQMDADNEGLQLPELPSDWDVIFTLGATPLQLCIALVKAAGKWKD